MSLIVTFNGNNYIIPTTGEVGWGSNLNAYFVALAAGAIPTTLTSGKILIGNVSNVATAVDVSGDATLSSTGVLNLADGSVTNNKVASGVFTHINGIGAQSQDLDMNGHKVMDVADGSLGAPGIAGATHPNNGLAFEIANNCVSLITGGIEALRVNGGQQIIAGFNGGGTSAVDLIPGIGFLNDGGTGIGLPIVDNLGLVAGASWAAVVSKSSLNDSAYRDTFTMFNGGGGISNFGSYEKFKNGTTTGISTSPTKIMTIDEFAVIAFISGNDGTNYFFDAVICGFSQATPAVLFQNTVTGSPASRTYTMAASTDLKLAMASGTYVTNVCSLQVHAR